MDMTDSRLKQEFVSVWVQDPQFHKDGFWHTHIDYEIGLHTNSMCFRRKRSCVRRQYSEFVWLRQRLQDNALLMDLPKLPPWNPFFSLRNSCQVNERMKGLQEFLQIVLQDPLVLSDSRLHLFLQSNLSVAKMDRCASGQTRYTVAQAIHRCKDCPSTCYPVQECKAHYDSDCESTTSSGLGHSHDSGVPQSDSPLLFGGPCEDCDRALCSCLSESACDQEHPES
ncbi:sorting nexin-10A [Esox lucius]|uniref:sorting nexin-10A n=1 Tax=Esox lucius TaxID=8010 RepID=UPI0014769B23|nr:sorting nexin-10A [Esox lucius]